MTLEIVREFVDDIALVSESEVEEAVYELLSNGRILTEGAAAATFAALMNRRFPHLAGKRVVVVLSGGNIDLNVLNRVIERAQVREARLARLSVAVGDRPGSLAGVLRIVGEREANVINVQHERSFSHRDLWQVEIELVLETRNREHLEQVVAALKADGYDLVRELSARPLPLEEGG
jgi:threonine dehydratase